MSSHLVAQCRIEGCNAAIAILSGANGWAHQSGHNDHSAKPDRSTIKWHPPLEAAVA